MSHSDEPTPDRVPILASDAERDRAVARLRDAVGEGRLTLEEFSERVTAAHVARTDADLAVLARDLPAAPEAPPLAERSSRLPETLQEHRAICSHVVRQGPWSLSESSTWRSIFGTIDLDLREARLASAETRLVVRNVFGTVTIVVPEGLEVVVHGGGLFASQKIEAPARPPQPGGPRLVIECHGPGGTLHVRSRPPRTFSLKALLTGE